MTSKNKKHITHVPGPGTDSLPPMVSPPPPKPRVGGLPFVLPSSFPPSFFFPSFLSPFPPSFLLSLLPFSCPSLFPFFPPSLEAMSAAHHHHRGEEMLCNTVAIEYASNLFIEPFLLLIFSLNPFCFYIHSSKLYICSYNLYRELTIDNHHTTTPQGGDIDHWGAGGSLWSCNIYIHNNNKKYLSGGQCPHLAVSEHRLCKIHEKQFLRWICLGGGGVECLPMLTHLVWWLFAYVVSPCGHHVDLFGDFKSGSHQCGLQTALFCTLLPMFVCTRVFGF